jgi:general secretion pathway protein M
MIGSWSDVVWLRKLLFAALNGVAGLAIYTVFIAPILDFLASRESYIADQQALLARFSSVAAEESKVQAISGEIGTQLKRGEFLAGPNEGVISAELQNRLKGMAESTGARLRSIQALPAETKDKIRYLGARLEIFGQLQAIQRTIYTMESGTPYLFVTAAIVRPSTPITSQSMSQELTIDARLDIYGAVQPREGSE